MNLSDKWSDYECLATGNGYKLERWGNIILNRPDPSIIWSKSNNPIWNSWDGYYKRSNLGGGAWSFRKQIPEFWTINYHNLTFRVSPTNFKHTGIFPEQATNWDYITKMIKDSNQEEFKVLNLFAYTGCATMAASAAGASTVVHVDSSKGIIDWAKENMHLSHLENNTIRFIQDDVLKFLDREIRRGNKYQGIIMDPPSYGRGPNKEVWRFEDNIQELLDKVKQVLSPDYKFLLISCYTTGTSPTSLGNILSLTFPNSHIETGEIGLPVTENNLKLPCGIYGKVEKR